MYVYNGEYKDGLLFYSQILCHDPVIPQEFSPEAANLITSLLEKDPCKRLGGGNHGAIKIKMHPFFSVSSFSIYVRQYCVEVFNF
jgi:hypothetical protein